MSYATYSQHSVRSVARRPHSTLRRELSAFLWALPAILFYVIFALVPLGVAGLFSFVQWDGISNPLWAGWTNWLHLFADGQLVQSIELTLMLMIVGWLLQTPLSLLLGVFSASALRYRAVFSVFYFLPLLFSTVAIALTWTAILDPNFGVINLIAQDLHLPPQGWLGDTNSVFLVLICLISWQFIPFHILLYQGAVRQLPIELYEAARLAGAGRIQQFFSITLPLLKYTIITSSMLMLTGSLTYFDIIWVMTKGGPGTASRVLPLHMYISAFIDQNVGYGSTVAVVLALAGILLSLLLVRSTGFAKMNSQLEGL